MAHLIVTGSYLSFDSGPTGQHGTTCFYFVLCLPMPPKARPARHDLLVGYNDERIQMLYSWFTRRSESTCLGSFIEL
jgi:hypothetical protein